MVVNIDQQPTLNICSLPAVESNLNCMIFLHQDFNGVIYYTLYLYAG